MLVFFSSAVFLFIIAITVDIRGRVNVSEGCYHNLEALRDLRCP